MWLGCEQYSYNRKKMIAKFFSLEKILLLQTVSEGQKSRSSFKTPGLSRGCSQNVWCGHSPRSRPRWLTPMAVGRKLQFLIIYMSLSTGLPENPHAMIASFPQTAKSNLSFINNLRNDTPSLLLLLFPTYWNQITTIWATYLSDRLISRHKAPSSVPVLWGGGTNH